LAATPDTSQQWFTGGRLAYDIFNHWFHRPLTAQRFLRLAQVDVSRRLEQIATGYRINRGADDPAGLIASENLGAEAARLSTEIRNLARADAVANVADGALAEVSSGLNRAGVLAVANANSAGLSDAERQANQFEIDAIVAGVNRVANATSFAGTRLFSGNVSLSTGANTLVIPQVTASSLGQTDVNGTDEFVSSVVSGGRPGYHHCQS
jgi:flagellin